MLPSAWSAFPLPFPLLFLSHLSFREACRQALPLGAPLTAFICVTICLIICIVVSDPSYTALFAEGRGVALGGPEPPLWADTLPRANSQEAYGPTEGALQGELGLSAVSQQPRKRG